MKNLIETALFLLIFSAFSAPSQAGILDALGMTTYFSGTYSHTSPDFNGDPCTVSYDFNKDGTVVWAACLRKKPVKGTYTVKGDEITVTIPDREEKFTRQGDVLIGDNGWRYVRGEAK